MDSLREKEKVLAICALCLLLIFFFKGDSRLISCNWLLKGAVGTFLLTYLRNVNAIGSTLSASRMPIFMMKCPKTQRLCVLPSGVKLISKAGSHSAKSSHYPLQLIKYWRLCVTHAAMKMFYCNTDGLMCFREHRGHDVALTVHVFLSIKPISIALWASGELLFACVFIQDMIALTSARKVCELATH